MRRSVVFGTYRISLAATVPGRQQWGFLTTIACCATSCAAFVAKWKHGGVPPVDLRAICLTRAMVSEVDGCRCSFYACTCCHITILWVVVFEKPHKKTYTYSSIDTKVNGRIQSQYKMTGEFFFLPNLHLLTLLGKWVDVGLAGILFFLPNLHLLTLLGKWVDVGLVGELLFSRQTYIYSLLLEKE